jgi:hypothetical protein
MPYPPLALRVSSVTEPDRCARHLLIRAYTVLLPPTTRRLRPDQGSAPSLRADGERQEQAP